MIKNYTQKNIFSTNYINMYKRDYYIENVISKAQPQELNNLIMDINKKEIGKIKYVFFNKGQNFDKFINEKKNEKYVKNLIFDRLENYESLNKLFEHDERKHKVVQTKYTGEKDEYPRDYMKRKGKFKIGVKYQVEIEKEKHKYIKNKNEFKTCQFDNLKSKVEKQINDARKPFKLILKSCIIDYKTEINFNNIWNFRSWFNKSVDKVITYDGEQLENAYKDKDVYSKLMFKIEKVKGGCNKRKGINEIKFNTNKYEITCDNSYVDNNDCGLLAISKFITLPHKYVIIKKQYNLKCREKIEAINLLKIYNDYKKETDKNLIIIDKTYNELMNLEKNNYILISNGHYRAVQSIIYKSHKDKKTKRGCGFFDLEARKTEKVVMIGENESKILKDTITWFYYKPLKTTEYKKIGFESDENTSSCRKFLNFLEKEASNGKYYNIISHNGARFDNYFLLSNMNDEEIKYTDMQLRGYSIIGMQYKSHLFKDSYCFMTFSLKDLCESYKINDEKKTKFNLHGKEMTNENLCFYKPELSFNEFLQLKNNDKEYWNLYNEYCLYDCISLSQIWEKFTKSTNELIKKMSPYLLKKCNVESCNTIGSHSIKIIDYMNKNNKIFKKYLEFIDYKYDKKNKEEIYNKEKYDFLNGFKNKNNENLKEKSFKIGGISHCNRPAEYKNYVSTFDINSQYPWTLKNMKIPVGKSYFTEKYEQHRYGFYYIKNINFTSKYKYKPVASVDDEGILNWRNDHIEILKLDSFKIEYMINNYGMTFEVIKGLVSNEYIYGDKFFGKYVDVLYNEKAKQDEYKSKIEKIEYKDKKDNLEYCKIIKNNELEIYLDAKKCYNSAYRETVKLYLNSVTGRLVMDPSKYFKLEFKNINENNCKNLKLGNNEFEKVHENGPLNKYLICGILCYSFSKMLLFEYINCLPNKSDDVIHTETDSFDFETKQKEKFIENLNNYDGIFLNHLKIGKGLGNIKLEHELKDTIFVWKKFKYYYDDKKGMKIKSIPLKTIDEHGNEIKLVNRDTFLNALNGKIQTFEFSTMKKSLFGETYISSYKMKRTVNIKDYAKY